jgi:hypothetical protein
MSSALTKSTDAKGRVTLGQRFANRVVLVKNVSETEVLIELATVVPDRELWLHKNKAARISVQRGLRQARDKKFVTHPPDLVKDAKLAKRLSD